MDKKHLFTVEMNLHDIVIPLKRLRKLLLKESYKIWLEDAKKYEHKKKPGVWPWRNQYFTLKEALVFTSWKEKCCNGQIRHCVVALFDEELCTISSLLKLSRVTSKNTKVYLNSWFATLLARFMLVVKE